MDWQPEKTQTEEEFFEDYLKTVLGSSLPELPPREQTLGSTVVSWWDGKPGDAVIMSEGGSLEDRYVAEQILKTRLAFFGYKRAQFTFDGDASFRKTADWNDIMNKAKRLIQSGQVTVLRNGFQYIVGHVIGDHGEYVVEISRDDPNSRAITMWQCECPWDQYAWQRTRQWKKYEGRPCSHVMALYWKSLATPLDEQLTPEQAAAMGTGQKLPAPATGPPSGFSPHPGPVTPATGVTPGSSPVPAPGAPAAPPMTAMPTGEVFPADQQQGQLFPPSQGLPPNAFPPAPGQPMVGTGSPDILPAFPGAQMEMQFAEPGTTPHGMEAPPGSVTVPGARIPNSPYNPMQNPGTYSKVQEDDWAFREAAGAQFYNGEIVTLVKDTYGLAEGPKKGEYGDGQYRLISVRNADGSFNHGEVLSQDATTGWVEVIFPLHDSGPHEPYHVRCFLEPNEIKKSRARPPGDFIRRR